MENQDKATRLVEREIYCCVSTLMSAVLAASRSMPYKEFRDEFCIDEDDLLSLFQSPNYEEAARQFVMDDADVDQLKEVADENGYWDDVLDACLPELEGDLDPENEGRWTFLGAGESFEDEDEAREAAIESVLPEIREAVWAITTNYEEVCSTYNLDYEYDEVYEHWVVSDWLAKKLSKRGEVTGEVAGLTVWGRGCSGQSISMDWVIQEIAAETYS